jgi:cytochrome P450
MPRLAQAVAWAHRYAEFTEAAHRRYGPSFTAHVGGLPAGVVTKDRDVIRRLLTGDPSRKRHANDLLREGLGERSVLLLEPNEHLRRRKLLSPPFHGERVRAYARLMEDLVAAETERWRPGEEVTFIPVAQRLTLEVILQAVLGVSDPDLRDRLRGLFNDMLALPGAAVAMYYPAFQQRSRWNQVAEVYWRKRDKLDQLLGQQIAATRVDPRLSEREDILAMLIQARDEDGTSLTDLDLLHEVNTLVSAGHETTATAIAWAAELLAHNPPVQARAREGEPKYLDAVVKEVLRIRTPVTVAAARHPLDPFEIGEYTVDPEFTIIVNAYGVHHDPDTHPDPERFRPERFLEPTPDYSFLPFGGGAHRCLGAALAQLEIKVAITGVLTRFELQPTAPAITRPSRRGITLYPKAGGRVRLRARPALEVALERGQELSGLGAV